MITKPVDIDCVIKYNPSVYKSINVNLKRSKFMKEVIDNSFDRISKKYCTPSFLNKLKGKIFQISICKLLLNFYKNKGV